MRSRNLTAPQPEPAGRCDSPVVIDGRGSFVGTNQGDNGEIRGVPVAVDSRRLRVNFDAGSGGQ